MSDMRGIDTPVRERRRRIFREVANLAYHSENLKDDMEALPYKIVDYEQSEMWESVYRDRAVTRERIRLAMGMSLRPEDRTHPGHLTEGLEGSDIAEKYYEPPLMQVIPSACNACPENRYEVTSSCMGCTAHPCQLVCPRQAIHFENGRSVIDQEKCIQCGKCREICPYDAICHKERPCKHACGIGAIEADRFGRAVIDSEKCVSCGMCMVSCPFGAIADKSQIFQLIRAMQKGQTVIAQIAPAWAGQFGAGCTAEKFKIALKMLGFADIYETAIGADQGCMAEAEHYAKEVATGHQEFALTSCCPSWSVLAKRFFPETIDKISNELTPMVATARIIKWEHPEALVVFIGPCASKKLEASRRTVRSDVDFVITFEELCGMFEAKGIDPAAIGAEDTPEGGADRGRYPDFGGKPGEDERSAGNGTSRSASRSAEVFAKEIPAEMEQAAPHDATSAGRGYGIAGGVAGAIKSCLDAYYPGTPVRIEHAEGLADCKKALTLAKAGRMNGCLIEGMACPGGCVAGAGTNLAVAAAAREVAKFRDSAERKLPDIHEGQER